MELKISKIEELAPVKFNFEELKNELLEKSERYKTAIYTAETISIAKQDRANLNKLIKAVNNEKIRVKNEIMKPYLPFENQCKELMEIVKDAAENIDIQIKTFEQKQQDEKKTAIEQYFNEHVGLYQGLISFDLIFNERWLNITYDIDKILQEIEHIFAKAKNDLMTIDSIVKNEETNKQVQDFYFKNIDKVDCLGLSLNEAKSIEASKARLEEMKQKQQEEQERQQVKQTIIPQQEQQTSISEKLYELNFKVHVTKEQANLLKEFFISNNIKYERLDK